MRLFEVLVDMLGVLEENGVRAALLGGLAVSVWTEPRFTRDVDMAVAVNSDAGAEALVHALNARGYRLMATVEQKAVDRLATVRMLPPGESSDGMLVDLLFASSGIEAEIVSASTLLDIGATAPVPVAQVGHLIALKLLSEDAERRPQDGADLRALRKALDAGEAERARTACRLIEERGYNRGRDLQALLTALIAGGA